MKQHNVNKEGRQKDITLVHEKINTLNDNKIILT